MDTAAIILNPRCLAAEQIVSIIGNQAFGQRLIGSGKQYHIKASRAKCKVSVSSKQMFCTSSFWGSARFLPYRPDCNCSITLDSRAKLFVTGPLSGCNVYVNLEGKHPKICHANSNESASDIGANNIAKRRLASEALGGFTYMLERPKYRDDFTAGIVLGVRDKRVWSFYVYGIRLSDVRPFVTPITTYS